MPLRLINEISDQSNALSLEFANSAFGLKQCKFVLSGTLLSPRLVTKDFIKSLKGISPVWKKLLHNEKGDAYLTKIYLDMGKYLLQNSIVIHHY
jgi:hypothetical protein